VALCIALVIACQSVWDMDRLSRRRYSFGSATSGKAAMTGTACLGGPELRDILEQSPIARANAVPRTRTGKAGASNPELSGRSALLSPAAAVTCRIAMGATMTFMLLSMI
jgi:hypothetical protein